MRRADYDQALEAARRWIAEHGRYHIKQECERWGARPADRPHNQSGAGAGTS
jgi:hypothetical protein